MFSFSRIEVSGFPKLGWFASVEGFQVKVRHGTWVEYGDAFVVEGAWNGEFREGMFDTTDTIFGTGVKLRHDSVVFVPSTATTDPIYHMTVDGRLCVANSLPLLLAHLEAELEPAYREYHDINASIVDGIDSYRRKIPCTAGMAVRVFHRNLLYTTAGTVEIDKGGTGQFASYAEYRDFLEEGLRGIIDNARSLRRRRSMQVFSTQSSGFDSTAVNAIAAASGIDRVFSNAQGKDDLSYGQERADVADDGASICEALGLRVTAIDRHAFEVRPDAEHLYLSALSENSEYNLHGMIAYVTAPTLVLTGQYGEVWRPATIDKPGQLNSELRRHDLGGQGWSELRLEYGFMHVPVPFLGARNRIEISRITGSDEMNPWRSGNPYDKPIPARIAVERGVPRDLFGQSKKAAAVEFAKPCIPRDARIRAEYFAFLVGNGLVPRWALPAFPLVHRINSMIWFARPVKYRVFYYLQRLISKLAGRHVTIPLVWERLRGAPYCFAVNRRVQELRKRGVCSEI